MKRPPQPFEAVFSCLMPPRKLGKLRLAVQQVHAYGRKVRLWGCPENRNVWYMLLLCGADLIATDRLVEFRNSFSNLSFTREREVEVPVNHASHRKNTGN